MAAWRSLSGADRRSLAALACALPIVELSLRLLGARRTAAWLTRLLRPGGFHAPTAIELQQAERLARLAAIAGPRVPVAAHCLSQSLLVQALLRRRGLEAEVQVGVRKNPQGLDAHAWVQLAGRALAQTSLQHLPLQASSRGPTAPP
ncbi:MAG TPA: lasso peptide biosynthesis B2 protein [Steroidobacteraceae bacterium]